MSKNARPHYLIPNEVMRLKLLECHGLLRSFRQKNEVRIRLTNRIQRVSKVNASRERNEVERPDSPSCIFSQSVLESGTKLKFGIVRKFLPFLFPSTIRFAGWKFRKIISRKHAFPERGALCVRLAEFRCKAKPLSLLCVFAHGSLVVRREILLKVTWRTPVLLTVSSSCRSCLHL